MPLNTYFRVDVSDTERDRNYWASRTGLGAQSVAAIRAADIVLVPWEDRAKAGLSFPAGTTPFFRLLTARFGKDRVAIAVEPGEYRELALHENEQRWPSMLVSTLLLGTLSNILAAEIESLLHAPDPVTSVELTVTVENERGKCISVAYKGPANRLVDTLINETNRCFAPASEAISPIQRNASINEPSAKSPSK